MKNAKEIVLECKKIIKPNLGVKALADNVLNDSQFCIMDNKEDRNSYREQCPDVDHCICSDYMLACLSSRDYGDKYLIGDEAIEIYNNAMK